MCTTNAKNRGGIDYEFVVTLADRLDRAKTRKNFAKTGLFAIPADIDHPLEESFVRYFLGNK